MTTMYSTVCTSPVCATDLFSLPKIPGVDYRSCDGPDKRLKLALFPPMFKAFACHTCRSALLLLVCLAGQRPTRWPLTEDRRWVAGRTPTPHKASGVAFGKDYGRATLASLRLGQSHPMPAVVIFSYIDFFLSSDDHMPLS